MTISEWIEFSVTLFRVAIVVVPICIVLIIIEMIRLIVWLIKKTKEERDE